MKTLFTKSVSFFVACVLLFVLTAGLVGMPRAWGQDACDPSLPCYTDTFTEPDGPAARWTPVTGDWMVENGEYSGSIGIDPWATAYTFLTGTDNWSDYKVEVSVFPIGPDQTDGWRAALVVRANPHPGSSDYDYYQIHTYRGGLRISKIVDGGTAQDFYRAWFDIPANAWHTLGVEVNGNQLKFYYNGALVTPWPWIPTVDGAVIDEGLGGCPPFLSGMIGLRVWGHVATPHVHFDDVEYCVPTPTLLPPIREDGPNLFQAGRTIPVKFQLMDACGNSIPDATAQLFVNDNPAVSSGYSNYENFFRYEPIDEVYVFNLSTIGLPIAPQSNQLEIRPDDGARKTFQIILQ